MDIGNLGFFMPILGVIFTLALIVTVIIVYGSLMKAKILATNKEAHQELITQIYKLKEIVQENKNYIENMSEKIDSIDKIMKDV